MSKVNLRRGSRIGVRIFDGIGCGGCAAEAQAALASRYGALRRGMVQVESLEHTDVLLLCGSMLSPLLEEVQVLAERLPKPWACLRMGDCGAELGSLFEGEVSVCGCPPSPEAILQALEQAWRTRQRSTPVSKQLARMEEDA